MRNSPRDQDVSFGIIVSSTSTISAWVFSGLRRFHDSSGALLHGVHNDALLVDGLALNDNNSTFGSNANTPSGPPVYSTAFDWNLDGNVDGVDLNQLYTNFGTIWKF